MDNKKQIRREVIRSDMFTFLPFDAQALYIQMYADSDEHGRVQSVGDKIRNEKGCYDYYRLMALAKLLETPFAEIRIPSQEESLCRINGGEK